jgi:hypothetical protein
MAIVRLAAGICALLLFFTAGTADAGVGRSSSQPETIRRRSSTMQRGHSSVCCSPRACSRLTFTD